MVISTNAPPLLRSTFLAGVKAAFVVSQLNRLGQILCARCGAGFTTLESAWANLELERVLETDRGGYRGDLDWGEDHPNYLLLACSRCRDRT